MYFLRCRFGSLGWGDQADVSFSLALVVPALVWQIRRKLVRGEISRSLVCAGHLVIPETNRQFTGSVSAAHKGPRRALRTTRRSRLQIVVEKVFVTFVPSMMPSVCWLVFVSRASISTALERARPQRDSEQNDCPKNYAAKLQDLRQRRIIPEYKA
jgi:hypothetical protein